MKTIFKTLMLTIMLGMFSGFSNAQQLSFEPGKASNDEGIEQCYDGEQKVIVKERKNKEDKVKEKKAKQKVNCFTFYEGYIVITDSKGKEQHHDILSFSLTFTGSGFGFLLETTVGGEAYMMLVDYNMMYVGVHNVEKNQTVWYGDYNMLKGEK